MSKQYILASKGHKFLPVLLHPRKTFKKTQEHTPLSPDRIVGVDSESFQNREYGAKWRKRVNEHGKVVGEYNGGLRTNLVALDYVDSSQNVVLETGDEEYPIVPMLNQLWHYTELEVRPSKIKQRAVQERPDGDRRPSHRRWIEPILLVFFNLEYDLGRLTRNHPQFQRAIAAGATSVTVQMGKYEVEITQLILSGGVGSFEFYIRHDGEILRLIGRDIWAYIKTTLEEAAECFLGEEKDAIDKRLFHQEVWEDITEVEEMLARLKHYVATDARLARELYEVVAELLTSIDKHVICRNGILPKSAAGAAARMAFSMASKEEWDRPPQRCMRMGAYTYAGGRVIMRKPGYYEHINGYDIVNAHGFVMTQLPDPCTCEYVKIARGPYLHDQWRSQFGVMLIDGEGLDPYYPALRMHDQDKQRLRYVYGPFRKLWATIPEVVIGVESGRLRVDWVHDGVWIKGSKEDSFLRTFVLKLYQIKQDSLPGSPRYLLAKLLINSLAGKLGEVILNHPQVPQETAFIEFPDVDDIATSAIFYKQAMEVYIQHGDEGLRLMAADMDSQCHFPHSRVLLQDIMDYHTKEGKAGAYYLPLHYAQITGWTSARLGVAAWCTDAVAGHTDSIWTIGNQSEGLARFHEIERAAGYESPEEGIGSFRQEVYDGHGILLRGNLYAIKHTDRTTGEVDILKCATHGLPDLPKSEVYAKMQELLAQGYTTYQRRARPRKLKEASVQGREPGVFEGEPYQRTLELDPNMMVNEAGEQVWKVYDGPAQSWQWCNDNETNDDNNSGETIPPDIEPAHDDWVSDESNQSLNQETIPPDIASSSVQEATRKRSSSGLNKTRPSEPMVKSPRRNVSLRKKASTSASTSARNGSTRSYTNDMELTNSLCKNPQAGSSPSP